MRTEARRVLLRLPSGVVSQEELEQLGHLGLLEAQERFDPRRGVPLELFARHRVRGAIFDGLRQINVLNRRAWQYMRREALAHEAAGEPAPVPPTGPDPAQDGQVVYSAIVRMAMARIADEMLVEPSPDEAAEEVEVRAGVRAAFDLLAHEEQLVLTAVYDLHDNGDSGAALGRRRGLSRSSVSRLHMKALDRLKRLMESTQ